MISVSSGSGLRFTRRGPRLSGLGLDIDLDRGITVPTGPTIDPQDMSATVRDQPAPAPAPASPWPPAR